MLEYNTSGDGGPLALDIDVEPGTLVTLIPHHFDSASATLPLMLLTGHPADKELADGAVGEESDDGA